MKQRLFLGLFLLAVCGAGCASYGQRGQRGQPANQPEASPPASQPEPNIVAESKRYTSDEMTALNLCVSIGDISWHVAQQKARGASLESQLEHYQTGQYADMAQAFVREVFERTGSPLDVTSAILNDCVPNLAKIADDRAGIPRHCLNVQLFALDAFAHRLQSMPVAEAQKHYPLPFLHPVVERVYAYPLTNPTWKDRVEVAGSEWARCFNEAG
jgi:hypothetical protein